MGDLVEDARAAGRVGDEQWRRYARQGLVAMLETRPDIRQGDPMPLRVSVARRTGRQQAWQMWLEVGDVRAAGTDADVRMSGGIAYTSGSSASSLRTRQDVSGEQTDAFAVGPARVTARAVLIIGEYRPTANGWAAPGSAEAVPLLERATRELSTPFVVRGRDEPPRFTVDDESLREGIESKLWVSPLRLASAAYLASGRSSREEPWEFGVRSAADGGVPLEYAIVLQRGGEERTLPGYASMSSGRSNADGTITQILGHELAAASLPPAGPDGDATAPVTVILRPDLEAIKRRLGPTPVWGRDIVFRDVPLRRGEDEQPGRDWQSGPWQSPGGSVIDPDAKLFLIAPATRPATRP